MEQNRECERLREESSPDPFLCSVCAHLGGNILNRSPLTVWLLPDNGANGNRISTHSRGDPWPWVSQWTSDLHTNSNPVTQRLKIAVETIDPKKPRITIFIHCFQMFSFVNLAPISSALQDITFSAYSWKKSPDMLLLVSNVSRSESKVAVSKNKVIKSVMLLIMYMANYGWSYKIQG